MKKILAFFTVTVYFAFACGVMVNYHFCMDRFASFRLYQPAGNSCQTCGMHLKKQGCCHDEVKIVKLQTDYQASSVVSADKKIQGTPVAYPVFHPVAALTIESSTHKINHSPPPVTDGQDTYLQNCVFRI